MHTAHYKTKIMRESCLRQTVGGEHMSHKKAFASMEMHIKVRSLSVVTVRDLFILVK